MTGLPENLLPYTKNTHNAESAPERAVRRAPGLDAIVAAEGGVEAYKRQQAVALGGAQRDGAAEERARHLANEDMAFREEHDVDGC